MATGIKLVAISNEAAKSIVERLRQLTYDTEVRLQPGDIASLNELAKVIDESPDASETYGVFGVLQEKRPEMYDLIHSMAATQLRKAKEYAKPSESYSNYVSAGAAIGVKGWMYAEARLAEKQARHEQLIQNGGLETCEGGYKESSVDRANMALIACVMQAADL